jgi:hypothetical protein
MTEIVFIRKQFLYMSYCVDLLNSNSVYYIMVHPFIETIERETMKRS